MIVRIMGEGQWTLADEHAAVLNALDAVLPAADSAIADVRELLSESDEGLIPG